ncbi:hypothetical protein BH23PLA1_BH23PLA1_00480 [soil metagenome]
MATTPQKTTHNVETATSTANTAWRGPSPWTWALIAAGLLAIAGGVRTWQDHRFEAAVLDAQAPPYPMSDLPGTVGPWRMLGDEGQLDDRTIQIAGCSDYITRTYVDERTGVSLTVLVAYGPAERVFPHSPLVCFPAVGFAPDGERRSHPIPTDRDPALFRSSVYARRDAGNAERVEVYYSFRHAGRWSPDAAETQNRFRHDPAMFKVQVQRLVAPGEERGGSDNPIEGFLAELVPEIERRLAGVEPGVG